MPSGSSLQIILSRHRHRPTTTDLHLSISHTLTRMEELVETCSKNESIKPLTFSDDIDNTVSTPYVSAPSSPGEGGPPHSYGGGFFYSAPASPMHRSASSTPLEDAGGSFEFELSLSGEPAPIESMTSADELFFNGQIRPMKLSSHLQRPQDLAPFVDPDDPLQNEDGDEYEHEYEDRKFGRGRAFQFQSRDRRRKARSMSPLRSDTAFQWLEEFKDGRESTEINEIKEKLEAEDKQRADEETETPSSGASSRSSSVGRNSKRWVFLKELLYRSKSEGRDSTNRNRNHKFWSNFSFSPSSSKKPSDPSVTSAGDETGTAADVTGTASAADGGGGKTTAKKAVNGVGVNRKRRGGGRSLASAHEVHYNRNRAQAEEMRKKTFLPYRQGLLGCLGFSSKGYGAMNGFARALNPVSSR